MMDWDSLNSRFCGVLIDFSMTKGLVLFLKNKIDKIEVGSYLTVYLDGKSGDSPDPDTKLLGRIKNMQWRREELLRDELGIPEWRERVQKNSFCIEESKGGSKLEAIDLNFGYDPLTIGEMDFIGIPKEIPLTWMKVFEANEEEVEGVLGGKSTNSKFKVRINAQEQIPIHLEREQFLSNVLIIGSYQGFMSLVLRELLRFSADLPRIVFTKKAHTEFRDLERISIPDFQELVSNGFGIEYASDEQILNAATTLNPPQIRLLSNLLVQVRRERKDESKSETLRKTIERNMEAYDGRYEGDLREISKFLKTKWDENKNLNVLVQNNDLTIIDTLEEEGPKQIVFSKFLHAVMKEIDNRKRNRAPPLRFILVLEEVEDYVPSSTNEDLDSDKNISKAAFKRFISHPDTDKIGLVMFTSFPSRTDSLIHYLCPNRLFGEVFEKRELTKIEEVFGIEEIEIRRLRDIAKKENEWGVLFNFPSRFPVDIVDGILSGNG